MPQAEQTRLRRFIALFLGASLLFGFALGLKLNRHPGPEHERWSLAPGYGLAVTLPQVGELLDKLEITDGALGVAGSLAGTAACAGLRDPICSSSRWRQTWCSIPRRRSSWVFVT